MTSDATLSLIVSNLVAGYPRRPVLRGLDLAPMHAGSVTALVGPNGAGKSTLLRVLAGLIKAQGSAKLGDIELIGASPVVRSRAVAFMPQWLPQRAGLTVLESVITAIKAAPLGAAEGNASNVHHRALHGLDRIGIADLAMEPLDQLSGGQRQLASLAQAIARNPTLMLLDEPTSALDLGHQVRVMSLVRELADEGRIIVVVLHDLTLAVRWAHRIVVLHQGEVHADGPPSAAITSDILTRIYDVDARVEYCSRGSLQVIVDGLARHD